MAKRTDNYWQRRFEHLKIDEWARTEANAKQVAELHDKALAGVRKDIAAWYQRFMDNAGISSMADAKRELTRQELQEFKWTVEEYIQKGRENAIDGQWATELENASNRYHLTRLEALELQLRQRTESLYADTQQVLFSGVKTTYEQNYWHTAFALQKGAGVGVRMQPIDTRQLDVIAREPWAPDGKDFSERIWTHRDKLVHELRTEMTHMAIRGDGPDEAINNIAKRMGVAKSRAANLVQTEHAAFGSRAQADCFEELGVERYKYIATLDLKTSDICQDLHNKVFDMDDREIGINAPPMHGRCRSTTAPYFDDMETTQFARGADGETYEVPGDITYEEWYGEYVKGSQMQHEQGGVKITAKANQNGFTVDRQLVNSKAYHDKFDDLPFNKSVREALYVQAKQTLEHRDGTDFEDLCILDAKSGKEIAANRAARERRKVGLSEKQYAKVLATQNGAIILHNHPQNGRLSYTDIKNAIANEVVKASVLVGHNGEVHFINNLRNREKLESVYAKAYNKFKELGFPGNVAEGKALDYVYEKGDFFDYEKR